MFHVQIWTPGGWVRVCSENVQENGILAMREMFLGSPGIYRLISSGNRVIAVMGVG